MDRDLLAARGIHLPVLPTLVLGGLPGDEDWTPRLLRIGIDVVSSGADPDTDDTLAAAHAAAPFRPVKATGAAASLPSGAWLVEGQASPGGGVAIDPEHVVIAQDGLQHGDQNEVAAVLLPLVAENPAGWWVAARDLADCTPEDAELALSILVEGTKLVRLYLTKQQFEMD